MMTENYSTSLEIQSKTIDWLRFPLAFLVVAYHTSFVGGLICGDSTSSFLRVFFCVLGELAVPAFFFFSGYLFFSRLIEWNWNQWKGKIVKRCRTLLLPYLLWIILAIVIRFVYDSLKTGDVLSLDTFRDFLMLHGGGRIAYDKGLGFVEISSNLFGWEVANGRPIDVPLWFIRDLMVISILSPLWFFLLKTLKHWWLLLIGVAYVLNLGFPFSGCSLTGVFFFSFGAYFMLYGKLFTEAFYKLRWPIGVIAGALMIAGIIFSGRQSHLSVYLPQFFGSMPNIRV